MTPADNITELLSELAHGDPDAGTRVMPLIYAELRRIATTILSHEQRAPTLQATELVHEAYLRVAKPRAVSWKDRQHFFAISAINMRQLLVDHARGRRADKRGGDPARVPLDAITMSASEPWDEIIEIHEVLKRLEENDQLQAQICELRFFSGMTVAEISKILGISKTTVKDEWRIAKAFLRRELSTR